MEYKECKTCEFCDLFNNYCLIDNSKCYDKGKLLNTDCAKYVEGKWMSLQAND